MKPHRNRGLFKMAQPQSSTATTPVGVSAVEPRVQAIPFRGNSNAEETIRQLEKVVSEFMIQYPSHTQRLPTLRPGDSPLIAFVRSMAASMAAKQEHLEKLNQDVIEAAKEKERFLANMSHEVRTPMNGIFGMVNLLLEMDLDPVQRDHLEAIHSSSESLLNILDDILDYAKLNAKEMQLKPRPFELNRLIREVLLVYKATADSKNINLSATICESLPEKFIADDLRLKQILSNLVSNAIKFTDSGEVSITVQGIRKAERDQLLFQVRDTGIGISESAGRTLFAPFRQIDSGTSRCYSGTGLGLAISKNLVELMGGRVWFESQPGMGSSFFFTINYETPGVGLTDDDLVSRKKLSPPDSHHHRDKSRMRVLLVEDNKVNQKVALLTLQQLGCEVTVASNGQEAVDMADGPLHFDLILMDVNMPVMNGLDATGAIRKLDHPNAAIPIIAMTGMVFDEDKLRCYEAGMNDVITKPFDLNTLRHRIAGLHAGGNSGVALSS